MKDTAHGFIPSLCNTAYGLGVCLWALVDHPETSIRYLAQAINDAALDIVDYLRTIDSEKLKEYSQELQNLYHKFDSLTSDEKGQMIGYTIGKYGTEIFIGYAPIKTVSALKKIRKANQLCNLKSMALSKSNKKKLKTSALQHSKKRQDFFSHAKIHWDRQNKHIPGKHNYIEGKSIFDHPNAQELLSRHAGTGKPIAKRKPGLPDYREHVDFQEHIGYFIDEKTKIRIPTTEGQIRYSKDGAHIIPVKPRK